MNIEGIETSAAYRPTAMEVSLPEPPRRDNSEPAQSDPPEAEQKPTSQIQFTADQVSGKMRMQVVDPESGEVVRQVPPEELVAISRMLGLLFDRVA